MSKIRKIAEQVASQNGAILKKIKEEESYVQELYRTIIDELLYIRKKAISNNATTIVSDLSGLADELRDLAAIRVNDRFRNHLIMLIARIELFIKEYKRGEFGPGSQTIARIETITAGVIGAIKNTILKDLNQRHAELEKLEEEFRAA